uniref:Tautomerase cis-CaaD-like domain-containing protein n=1 Tax=Acrobeloides nanus TaxID=290746 RepID=A0A914E810_9BILA
MPLHRIFYPPGTFSEQDKEALAANITKLYVSRGLPAFYVVVLFLPVEEQNYFVGGKKTSKFVRIIVQHIARQFPSNKHADKFITIYEDILAPFIKDRGLDWEVHFELVDRNYWRENGLEVPLPNTIAEKEWIRLNKAVPYDEQDNVLG